MAREDTRTLVILLNGLDNDWSHWTEIPDHSGRQMVCCRRMARDGKMNIESIRIEFAIGALEQMKQSAEEFVDETDDFLDSIVEENKSAS